MVTPSFGIIGLKRLALVRCQTKEKERMCKRSTPNLRILMLTVNQGLAVLHKRKQSVHRERNLSKQNNNNNL